MKTMSFQASLAAALMLAAAWLASPVSAQTQSPPAPAQSVAQPGPVGPAPAATAPAAPAPSASMATAPAVPTAPPAAAGSTLPKSDAATAIAPAMKELSPWVMFMSADVIVKAVMIGLAFASLMTWTVFIAKSIELSVASAKLRSALKKIAEARSLAEAQMALGTKEGILPSFLAAALREARMSAGLSSDTGIKERAASSFSEIVRAEQRRIRIGMGVLATIGSTSPFVGLFGTVWGIMNSFIGISKSQTTNLAVVAPGIAEALLATAIGLVAAIPAVIIYNHFSRV
ncbi:tonB-system energizer ExbB, partial [Bradyrhizobium guangdongense]|uniref:tonB-system energizer ExbB n=1 Tax=Bradyrhizobium guangdongense TaxID=1325090 RepID=UPI001FD8CF17